MKRTFLMTIIIMVVYCSSVFGQILTPVKWSYGVKKINSKEAVIFFKATIENGWHIYSLHQNGGPQATIIKLDSLAKDYAPIGGVNEPKFKRTIDRTFNLEVDYFENEVVFQQRVKLKVPATVIKGKISYMACTDHQCLPPEDITFAIPVK